MDRNELLHRTSVQKLSKALGDAKESTGAAGDLYYRDANGALKKLPIASFSYVLKSDGYAPFWGDPAAPTVKGVAASSVSGTNITITLDSSEAGNYYYLVVDKETAAPSAATIKAQGTAVAKGTNTATKGANSIVVDMSSADPDTDYDAYLVVEDASNLLSNVAKAEFTTSAL